MKCADCGESIPKYDGNINSGFVSPAPKGSKEERAQVEFTQGPQGMTATAVERIVCADCYVEEFGRVYPGAELPAMPKRAA